MFSINRVWLSLIAIGLISGCMTELADSESLGLDQESDLGFELPGEIYEYPLATPADVGGSFNQPLVPGANSNQPIAPVVVGGYDVGDYDVHHLDNPYVGNAIDEDVASPDWAENLEHPVGGYPGVYSNHAFPNGHLDEFTEAYFLYLARLNAVDAFAPGEESADTTEPLDGEYEVPDTYTYDYNNEYDFDVIYETP